MQKIYFLCTGNSCRSQMAEGYGHALLPSDQFEIKSAGIKTHGLNPQAVVVMAEDGVDISRQTSDLLDAAYLQTADFIITLCGDAKDKCPAIPPTASQLHWDLQDPAQAQGSEAEILAAFRETRDLIKAHVLELLNVTAE